MERLEKEVEEVGAGGAALGEAIGSMPCGAIYLAIIKASTKAAVESFEGADYREGDTNLGQESKNRPPRQGVETRLLLKAGPTPPPGGGGAAARAAGFWGKMGENPTPGGGG